MKKIYLFILPTLICFKMQAQLPVTLLTNLEYPKALWIQGGNVYLTETAGRNTIYGGKISLDRYRISNGQKTVMVNNPENSDALVSASDGKVYLSSYQNSIPGQYGKFSVVDTGTFVETHLMDIAIASDDMFIEANDNISIAGMSDLSSANSIYYLTAGNYTSAAILQNGLGRVWCISKKGSDTYFSDLHTTYYFGPNGIIHTFMNKSVISITFSSNYLFYADYFSGTVGRVNLQTMADQILLSGLNAPINVRYDAGTNSLFFLESGTDGAQYKDGTLKVLRNVDSSIAGVASEENNNAVKIFPNPFTSSASVELNFPVQEMIFELYDEFGNIVKSIRAAKEKFEIERQYLAAGIYFYKISDVEKIIATGKLIIQ
ncbi:MAG: T9SS type A sorting domain-containing protein [Bacteroidetes bacterium]|nr:T9SS type A sorting domain-containing protein [Bacteroidota bacterium]